MRIDTNASAEINTQPISRDEFVKIQEFTKCIFCEPPAKKILIETDNFYVTYDACALLEGHAEIHTKKHIGCAAEIDAKIYDEFVELKMWLAKLISSTYGNVSFYEHGRAGHCSMTIDGVICHHFHMHALPLAQDISGTITHDISKPIILKDEYELPKLYEEYDQYLYFEDTKGVKYFFPVTGDIPSHYLRTVIATSIEKPERADWECYFNRSAINDFKRAIADKIGGK
jgi:hypothetical protein